MSHYPPQHQGGQRPAQQDPTTIGHIAVTAHLPSLRNLGYKSLNTPQIFLDGYQVAHGWGPSVFPSWPGRHHLYVHIRSWGSTWFRADIQLDVYSGHLVELDYRFSGFGGPGSLTYRPRR